MVSILENARMAQQIQPTLMQRMWPKRTLEERAWEQHGQGYCIRSGTIGRGCMSPFELEQLRYHGDWYDQENTTE